MTPILQFGQIFNKFSKFVNLLDLKVEINRIKVLFNLQNFTKFQELIQFLKCEKKSS